MTICYTDPPCSTLCGVPFM